MSKALKRAREAGRCCDDHYAIGGPALDAEGEPMRRCTWCGVPRGTFRHAIKCAAKLCDDPDSRPVPPSPQPAGRAE